MPALTATNVTVTVERVDRTNKIKRNRVKVVFGDGALTYPSGGVPLPSFPSFGMRQGLFYLKEIDGDDSSGILWKYDRENFKLRGYLTGGAGTPVLTAAGTTVVAGGTPVTSTSATGPLTPGPLIELTTSLAPASQTLYFEAVGK